MAPRQVLEPGLAGRMRSLSMEAVSGAREYESIASFSELALDLMTVGTSAALVERCHRAARSRQTEMCLTVARSLDVKGGDVAAGPHANGGDPLAFRTRSSHEQVTHALKARLILEASLHRGREVFDGHCIASR